jgi:hypothetical protein
VSEPRRQSPRYRDRTVVLQTIDHGEVTVPEPAWCIGHDDDLVEYLADITHDGPVITADATTTRYGRERIMEARISQAPHGEIRPEPLPLLHVHLDVDATVATEDGRNLTRALRAAAARNDRALDELAHLRGERP